MELYLSSPMRLYGVDRDNFTFALHMFYVILFLIIILILRQHFHCSPARCDSVVEAVLLYEPVSRTILTAMFVLFYLCLAFGVG